jgi:Cof subfamily protein (haloacid dehalogenase superfamily)
MTDTRTVVCLDLDGTLLDAQERIHPQDVRMLQDNHDVIFIPATGRSLDSTKRVFACNGLFEGTALPFPLILLNGSLLYGFEEQLLAYQAFAPDTQRQLLQRLYSQPEVCFLLLGLERNYLLSPTPFGIAACLRYQFLYEQVNDSSQVHIPISKVMCFSEKPDALAQIAQEFATLPVEGAFSMETIFELTPPGIDKGSGLRILLQRLDLSPATILAAGDGGNDLNMLNQADISITTATASSILREQVDFCLNPASQGILQQILALGASTSANLSNNMYEKRS